MINISKLENCRNLQGKQTFRCPICNLNGKDVQGNHLVVFKDGKFGCIVDDSKEHRSQILKLAGLNDNEEIGITEYKQPIPQVERFYPNEILNELVKDHTYYLDKGIKETVLNELKSGVAIKGSMNGRYVFPIFTPDGRIHGFSGRTLVKAEMKWKHLSPKKNWVYPAHFVDFDIRNAKHVILVESIGDLIALMSAGVRNVLVLFGINLHSKLLSYLISLNLDKIYISTNNDVKHNVGQEAAEKIKRKLLNYFDESKIEIKFPTEKDFGEMTEEEIQIWKNK